MMKKLTRAALLAAATVFVLAGMTACEQDDKEEPSTEQTPGGGSTPELGEPEDGAKSFTADFTGLEASAFKLDSLTTGNATNLTVGETKVEFTDVTVTLKSTSTALRVRADENGKSVGINYNGSSFSSNDKMLEDSVSDPTSLRTYISVPITGAGIVTVTYGVFGGSSSGKDGAKIALLDKDGTVLKSAEVNTTTTNTTALGTTISTEVSATTENLYVMFSRENSSGGGIDVSKIEFTVEK